MMMRDDDGTGRYEEGGLKIMIGDQRGNFHFFLLKNDICIAQIAFSLGDNRVLII